MVADAHRVVPAIAHRAHESLPKRRVIVDDEHRSAFACGEARVASLVAHAETTFVVAAGSSRTTVVPC